VDEVSFQMNRMLNKELQKFPVVTTAIKEAADKIAAIAIANAPIGPDDEEGIPGSYRDGIEVQQTPAGWRVVATDQKSAWIEFGNRGGIQPKKMIMRNAVEEAGFKFKKGGR
jgi:hypothetical protein